MTRSPLLSLATLEWPMTNPVLLETAASPTRAWLESERHRYETTPGLLDVSFVARVRYREIRWALDDLNRDGRAMVPEYLLPPAPGPADYPATYDPQVAGRAALLALVVVLAALIAGAGLALVIGHP